VKLHKKLTTQWFNYIKDFNLGSTSNLAVPALQRRGPDGPTDLSTPDPTGASGGKTARRRPPYKGDTLAIFFWGVTTGRCPPLGIYVETGEIRCNQPPMNIGNLWRRSAEPRPTISRGSRRSLEVDWSMFRRFQHKFPKGGMFEVKPMLKKKKRDQLFIYLFIYLMT
jgi:hypothetical protein